MFRRTEDFRNFPKIYIPLCLYLYLLLSGLVSATGLHLHSTMFIFILISQSVQLFLLPIYIPLCLYLYEYSNQTGEIIRKFTFHYVYIYIRP